MSAANGLRPLFVASQDRGRLSAARRRLAAEVFDLADVRRSS
jgi:hypothetical protein